MSIEEYFQDLLRRGEFVVPAKRERNETEAWKKLVTLVKNRRRRFRYSPHLEKDNEVENLYTHFLELIKNGLDAYAAEEAAQAQAQAEAHAQAQMDLPQENVEGGAQMDLPQENVEGGAQTDQENAEAEVQTDLPQENPLDTELQVDLLTKKAKVAGYKIHPDKLASLVTSFDIETLKKVGGIQEILSRVKASIDEGVASNDLQIRKYIYGSNIYSSNNFWMWMFVWEVLHDVTLIILIVCAAVLIGVGVGLAWQKGIYDGLGIVLTVMLVVMVTAACDYKQSLQFRDLDKEKNNFFTLVTRDGSLQKVSIFDLVVGDIVHLSIGDQVPADGVFISGHEFLVDQSSLCGVSSPPMNVHENRPFLLAGTNVQDGYGRMLVTAVGMRTEWSKLKQTLSERGENETPLQVKLNGVATILGKIGVTFSVLTFFVLVGRFLIEKVIRHEFAIWSCTDAITLLSFFATAVAIVVVAIPEGLPLAVTLSLAFAMKKLMDEKALVRSLSACEAMGSATCICTDKTGTLTTSHMVVTKIWMVGKSKEIETNGPSGSIRPDLNGNTLSLLLQAIFHNTSAKVVKDESGKQSILGTPTESALLDYGLRLDNDFQRSDTELLKAELFDSEKKKMSVLVALPNGTIRAFCKGASEIIVKMCNSIINSSGEPVPLSEDLRNAVLEVVNGFACEALRTLCLAYKDIRNGNRESSIPDGGYTLIAIVGISDPVRPGIKEAVSFCHNAAITVRMVTGDNINTAKAIAKECGILTEGAVAIEGPEFRTMTPAQMGQNIPDIKVMARFTPADKQALVLYLKEMGETVAFVGDSTTQALKDSEIGITMGIPETEAGRESSDVVVLDDNFTSIVKIAKWGRGVSVNIQNFVQFHLTGIFVAVLVNFFSACATGSAPLKAVQLLWANLLMDSLGAFALVTEPPDEGLMNRKPVQRNAIFITKLMWTNILGQSFYQFTILLFFQIFGKKLLLLDGSDSTMILDTFIFNTFVFCQVFNAINSRDIIKINVFRGWFRNSSRIFLGVMAATVVFQIIIVEFLGTFASTTPLSWPLWRLSVGLGAMSMVNALVVKLITVGGEEAAIPYDGYIVLPSGPEMA